MKCLQCVACVANEMAGVQRVSSAAVGDEEPEASSSELLTEMPADKLVGTGGEKGRTAAVRNVKRMAPTSGVRGAADAADRKVAASLPLLEPSVQQGSKSSENGVMRATLIVLMRKLRGDVVPIDRELASARGLDETDTLDSNVCC